MKLNITEEGFEIIENDTITHLSTPEEVENWAIKENHTILYHVIQLYKYRENVTWGQAMQLAAITQAPILSEHMKIALEKAMLEINPIPVKI